MNAFYLVMAGVLVLGVGGYALVASGSTPTGDITQQELNTFAQCITENNATFYGSFTCGACKDQKAMFGDAMQYVEYVECNPRAPKSRPALCQENNVRKTPTWIIQGERYTGIQNLRDLAEATDCTLPR